MSRLLQKSFFLILIYTLSTSCLPRKNLEITKKDSSNSTDKTREKGLEIPKPIVNPDLPSDPVQKLNHNITFIRHVETCQNRSQDCNGDTSENRFTPNGESQARELGRYLIKAHNTQAFTHIFVSEMWRTGKSIESFVNSDVDKPEIVKDSRLNECNGGEVGCYFDRDNGSSFKSYLKSIVDNADSNQNILIVGHSRRGYNLLKDNVLGSDFFDIRSRAIEQYLQDCVESGRWISCKSKIDPQIKYREYSYIHNGLPIKFNAEEIK